MSIVIDRDYLIRTLTEMVRIDSINPDLVAGAAGEAELGTYIAGEMQKLGLQVETQALKANRINAVGILRGRGGGRSLMLNAHTDTVGVVGMKAPFSAEIRDGKLYGRGAYDMKASLAASLAAAKALIDADISLAGDLLLAAVIDEEYGSLGTEDVVKRYKVDGAIVTEPSDLRICVAHRGFRWLTVETIGRAAHGSRYQDGIDANRLMGYFLVELDKHAETLLSRKKHPLLGTSSLHAPTIQGGSASSVYAANCTLGIEWRVLPGETAADVLQEIQAIVDRLSTTVPNFKAIVSEGFGRDAFEITPDSPIVQTVTQATTDVLGKVPEVYGETFWTDAALLGGAGVETVIIGPAGGGIHEDEEWVELESVVQLAQILVKSSIAYCGIT